MSDLANIPIIESKSEAELTTMLARVGVKFSDLTARERCFWTCGYRAGYSQGSIDAIAEIRAMDRR